MSLILSKIINLPFLKGRCPAAAGQRGFKKNYF